MPDIVKNVNVKVFNLLARINESKQMIWHETCKCICRLTSTVCNERQIWNKDKCQCECREDLISKLTCEKGYLWNPSTCACECDKLCGVGQYLDYKNCTCRKSLINNLIEQCTNAVDMEIANSEKLEHEYTSHKVHLGFFIVFLILFGVVLGGAFYYWRKHNGDVVEKKAYDVAYSNVGTLNYETYKKFTVFLDLKSKGDCVNNAVFLKDFDPRALKMSKHDCVDRFVYYIDYNENPLYLTIPEVIGYVKKGRYWVVDV